MSEGDLNVSLTGDLSKPANTLIEKVSNAIGGIYKPYQIKRVAKAKAEAKKIEVISKIETTELEQRALQRFVYEETKKQNNIESITSQSIKQLKETAKPELIENDWITNFFDKCSLVSDEEMQDVWSRVLAGEANSPGKFSKRTINFMESLDKKDAQLFTKLCAFNWILSNDFQPLIYDLNEEVYVKNGISFDVLRHLDAIGLISFESLAGYKRKGFSQKDIAIYNNIPFMLNFPNENNNEIKVGNVLLTIIGTEIASICKPEKIKDFDKYIISKWEKEGVKVVNLIK